MVIRKCQPQELALLCEMANIDDRNPGLADASTYLQLDADGYFLALDNNEIIGAISGIKYGNDFGFIGMHMVHPDYRTTDLANALLRSAQLHLGSRVMGINCHESQLDYYGTFGFTAAHKVFIYQGLSVQGNSASSSIVSPFQHPFSLLQDIDSKCFPYDRRVFIQRWLNQTGSLLLAKLHNDTFTGYGLFRPCVNGYEISNLLCNDAQTASELIQELSANMQHNSNYFLHIPEGNTNALAVAEELRLQQHAEYWRMYSPAAPAIQIENVYSFSGREVG